MLYYDRCGIFEGVLTEADFESYKGQTLTVQKPTDVPVLLPGIPVESGGNYTDPVTKQQWVCDEVDFVRGKYIQRITSVVLNGTEVWTKPIVDGVDMFGEEEDSKKVIFIHSKQKTQLRKDPDFLSADKFQPGVLRDGVIGRIAGCDVKVSNKVKLEDGIYYNPIVKLDNDAETEDDMPAITYFLKRGNLVEHKRHVGVGDEIVCTAHGMPSMTNEAKIVILKTKEK